MICLCMWDYLSAHLYLILLQDICSNTIYIQDLFLHMWQIEPLSSNRVAQNVAAIPKRLREAFGTDQTLGYRDVNLPV